MNRTFKKFALLTVCAMALIAFVSPPMAAKTPVYPADSPVLTAEPTTHRLWLGCAADRERDAAGAITSEEVEVIEESPDRTKPIYEVYKDGWRVSAATVEIQWIIRDMSEKYDLPEKTIYGLILVESAFQADCVSASGHHFGLAQIGNFWITGANMPHFTDDYRSRDLFDPYDNLLTLAEMMCYARDYYHLDYSCTADLVKYLYWHNTGKDPTRVTKWDYATKALRFSDELVAL